MEKVLVFPATVLEKVLPGFDGICIGQKAADAAAKILDRDNLWFANRSEAETNPAWKQVIPYIVVRNGDRILAYQRTPKGGEARLHNKYSIGFGGHINPCDVQGGIAYEKCFWRELEEELGLKQQPDEVMPPPTALVYETSSEVGLVHVGIVHLLDVSSGFEWTPDIDAAVSKVEWISIQKLKDLALVPGQFETWSQLVVDYVLETSTSYVDENNEKLDSVSGSVSNCSGVRAGRKGDGGCGKSDPCEKGRCRKGG